MADLRRNASIELLRIISMVMIVMLHFLAHGQILKWSVFGSMEYRVYWIVEALLFVAVNCFVLISGYFLCLSNFKISRIIKIWMQVLFYSCLCTFVCIILGGVPSLKNLLKMVLPLSGNQYWFATTYVLMLCLSPLLNIAILGMNKKQHQIAVCVIALLFCLMPTFLVWERDLITNGMDYTWFAALYIIAAYFRKYSIPNWLTTKRCIGAYIICSLITGGVRIPLGILSSYLGFGYTLSGLFFRYNSILVMLASVMLFCFFLKLEIKNVKFKKIILQISPLTFAVYLIHDHPMVRNLLWHSLPMEQWYTSGIFVTLIMMIMTTLGIFIFSCFVEKARMLLSKKFKMDEIAVWVSESVNKILWGEFKGKS